MTGKDRILKAFSNTGESDRVPFTIGLENVDLVSLSGLDCWDYQKQGHTMLSELVNWSDELGFDVFHYAAGIPQANPAGNIEIDTNETQTGEVRIIETNVMTPLGKIQQRRQYPRFGPEFTVERYIKNINKDWPAFKKYFGDDWKVGGRFFNEYKFVGSKGVVGIVVHTPVDFWQEFRNGGSEQMIYDFLDEKKIMYEFCEYYSVNSLAYLEKVASLIPKPDFVLIHGSNCSASLISPHIFKNFALPYIEKASSLLKKHNIYSVLHICGKCSEWLGMIADTDVDVIDALEHPPAGNVDLAEVKRLYGKKLCLKGNVSAITMACGTAEQVRTEVRQAIDAAAHDGGFLLDVGDSIGPKVSLENIREFVKTAIEYGKC